jgi:hypothetical protein
MLAASQALASLALLSVGVIYGTDMFSALVLRPAMAALTDRELTQAAGRIHEYGDQLANSVRQARAELKRQIASGAVLVVDVLLDPPPPQMSAARWESC